MSKAVIIPARIGSTRLARKPLVHILGKSMIRRVYERCSEAGIEKVIVATDHDDILNHVMGFGGEAVLTATDCPSGTDRVAEAALGLGNEYDVIINVQGDE